MSLACKTAIVIDSASAQTRTIASVAKNSAAADSIHTHTCARSHCTEVALLRDARWSRGLEREREEVVVAVAAASFSDGGVYIYARARAPTTCARDCARLFSSPCAQQLGCIKSNTIECQIARQRLRTGCCCCVCVGYRAAGSFFFYGFFLFSTRARTIESSGGEEEDVVRNVCIPLVRVSYMYPANKAISSGEV